MAIALMLITGTFVGVNVAPYYSEAFHGYANSRVEIKACGWPSSYVIYTSYVTSGYGPQDSNHYWDYWAIARNVVCLLLTLAGVWLVLERPWRRTP
jgi:hypothetical protein